MANIHIMTEAEAAQANAGLPPDEWVYTYSVETPRERDHRRMREQREDGDRRAREAREARRRP